MYIQSAQNQSQSVKANCVWDLNYCNQTTPLYYCSSMINYSSRWMVNNITVMYSTFQQRRTMRGRYPRDIEPISAKLSY